MTYFLDFVIRQYSIFEKLFVYIEYFIPGSEKVLGPCFRESHNKGSIMKKKKTRRKLRRDETFCCETYRKSTSFGQIRILYHVHQPQGSSKEFLTSSVDILLRSNISKNVVLLKEIGLLCEREWSFYGENLLTCTHIYKPTYMHTYNTDDYGERLRVRGYWMKSFIGRVIRMENSTSRFLRI